MYKPFAVATGLTLAAISGPTLANGQSELCETQVKEYLTTTLGQTIEQIKFHWTYSLGNQATEFESQALVYTKECPGYHWFNLLGNHDVCQLQVYYGTPPNLIFYRGGYKGC